MTTMPEGYTIRRALRSDLEALEALEKISFPSDRLSRRQIRYHITNPRAVFLVCIQDSKGVLAGNALFFLRQRGPVRFYSLAVDPAHRGRGIGRALIQTGLQAVCTPGNNVVLEVSAEDSATISLYESAGFTSIMRLPGYYEDGRDGIRMCYQCPVQSNI